MHGYNHKHNDKICILYDALDDIFVNDNSEETTGEQEIKGDVYIFQVINILFCVL